LKYIRQIMWIGVALVLAAARASATPAPVPLYTECPHVGSATGCSYLVVIGPGGSTSILSDTGVSDVDTKDDVLIGIQNNSGSNFNLSGYTGPSGAFSGIHLSGILGNGKSTYFETTDPLENDGNGNDSDDDDGSSQKCVTPEPATILLLASGLIGVFMASRNRS
jgi:hypothetical protein